MRFLLSLALLPLALGASCSKGKLPTKDFTLHESKESPYLTSLDSIFTDKNVTITHVLSSSNRSLRKGDPPVGNGNPVEVWAWDSGDFNTDKWTPQGITSSADALGNGKWNDREVFMVSWHNKDDTDTKHGLRVFDLGRIWEMGDGEKVGKNGNGYSAAGYKYVIPQIKSYKWTADEAFRFSWVSLDRSDKPDALLIGEFVRDNNKTPVRLVKYELDAQTRELKTKDGVATSSFAYCVDFLKVQGGFSYDNTFYLSKSNGKAPKTGDLFKWKPGGEATTKDGWFMGGPEDLSYNPVRKEWYTVTEYAKGRYILAYKI